MDTYIMHAPYTESIQVLWNVFFHPGDVKIPEALSQVVLLNLSKSESSLEGCRPGLPSISVQAWMCVFTAVTYCVQLGPGEWRDAFICGMSNALQLLCGLSHDVHSCHVLPGETKCKVCKVCKSCTSCPCPELPDSDSRRP